MQFKFIGQLIKKNYISQSQGRLIEYSLICAFSYLLGVIISGDPFSTQALLVALLTPIWGAINKAKRDYDKSS